MRTYFIYLIEDEFADYFYGREIKFYDLFAADRQEVGELQTIVKRQIQYITKPLPYLDLHQHLSSSVQEKDLYIKGKIYYIRSRKRNEHAELSIGKRYIKIDASGGFEAESIFLKCSANLMADF